MVKFTRTTTGVELHYKSDRQGNNWVWLELNSSGSVTISSVFHFEMKDLLNTPPDDHDDVELFTYRFSFGRLSGGYIEIPGSVLDIDNNIFVESSAKLERKFFAAERNISIFGRLSDLLDNNDPIFIGGSDPKAIPLDVFKELLEKFPNTYEVDRYAAARVHTVLSAHLDGMKDARGRYENYLNRRMKGGSRKIDLDFIKRMEVEKYVLIRDVIKNSLKTKADISEREWQTLMMSFVLLMFPKYVKLLENVTIQDYYSDPNKPTPRYLDIALLDSNGNIDIIEIKKPFEDKILRKSEYRGNSIPTSELSGSIMQAEKYLFHLSKWGIQGEKKLNDKYKNDLPPGMKIKISNPKAIIIVGRDQIGGLNMSGGQILDFEIIKRKYAHMMDIITYDDLLRRLDNTIVSLGGEALSATP